MERYARYQQLWQKYLKDTDEILKNAAGRWLASPEQYEPAGYGYIIKANQPRGASLHILPMYDHLLSCKKEVPLLARFTSKDKFPVEQLLASNDLTQQ